MSSRRALMRAKLVEVASKSGGPFTYWKPRICATPDDAGELIRILTPEYLKRDDAYPWLETAVYEFQANGKTVIMDAPSAHGLPDPVLELKAELEASSDPTERELGSKIYPKDQYYLFILDLNDPKKGPQVWRFGNMVLKQLLRHWQNTDYEELDNLDAGHNLRVQRFGTGLKTEYVVQPQPKVTKFWDIVDNGQAIMDKVNKMDMARLLRIETEETIRELILEGTYDKDKAKERRKERDAREGRPVPLFLGGDAEDDEEEGTEGATAAKPTAPTQRPQPAASSSPKPPAQAPPPRQAPPPPPVKEPEPEPEPQDAPDLDDPNYYLGKRVKIYVTQTDLGVVEVKEVKDGTLLAYGEGDTEPWELEVADIQEVLPDQPAPRTPPKKSPPKPAASGQAVGENQEVERSVLAKMKAAGAGKKK